MGRKPFIGDGHDATIYLKGDDLYPPIRIQGRKMAGFQSTALVKEAAAADGGPDSEVRIYAERIASRIRSWKYLDDDDSKWKPLEDDKGNPLPVNAASFGGLQPKLMWRIRDIIMGTEASDVDPETGEQVVTNEADEKN